jgi:hypothetical protein
MDYRDANQEPLCGTPADRHWLAFSLAEIDMAPYVDRLGMLGMSEMWGRIKVRPAFRPSLLGRRPARPHQRSENLPRGKLAGREAIVGGIKWSGLIRNPPINYCIVIPGRAKRGARNP